MKETKWEKMPANLRPRREAGKQLCPGAFREWELAHMNNEVWYNTYARPKPQPRKTEKEPLACDCCSLPWLSWKRIGCLPQTLRCSSWRTTPALQSTLQYNPSTLKDVQEENWQLRLFPSLFWKFRLLCQLSYISVGKWMLTSSGSCSNALVDTSDWQTPLEYS